MLRVFAGLLLAFLIVLPACGGGGDDDGAAAAGSVDEVETCEQLADMTIEEFQELLDGLADVTAAEMQSDATPEALTEFEEDGEALSAKAEDLGCSDEDMARMLDERAGDLTAEGPFAELLLQEVQSGNFFQALE